MDYSILKTLRKAKSINQKELGRRVGVSGGYISDIERGIKTPNAKILEKICKEIGCELRILHD